MEKLKSLDVKMLKEAYFRSNDYSAGRFDSSLRLGG